MSKESEALEALDAAVARLEAWIDADDELDAAKINERVAKVNALMTPTVAGSSHLPVSTLTGERVDPTILPPLS